ncbi:MAG: hypothetical protein IJP38_06755, partial [Oscillospiraceae bacterium]|nr:hypothetical protein [Oscillospiraceae bacterium]
QNVQYFTLDFSLGNVKMLLQKCGDMCHEIKHLPLPEFLCKKMPKIREGEAVHFYTFQGGRKHEKTIINYPCGGNAYVIDSVSICGRSRAGTYAF